MRFLNKFENYTQIYEKWINKNEITSLKKIITQIWQYVRIESWVKTIICTAKTQIESLYSSTYDQRLNYINV